MIDKPAAAAAPSSFSPLARAVIDSVGEGIVVFDSQGRVLYANAAARRVVDGQNGDVRNRLQNLGARFASLKTKAGEDEDHLKASGACSGSADAVPSRGRTVVGPAQETTYGPPALQVGARSGGGSMSSGNEAALAFSA